MSCPPIPSTSKLFMIGVPDGSIGPAVPCCFVPPYTRSGWVKIDDATGELMEIIGEIAYWAWLEIAEELMHKNENTQIVNEAKSNAAAWRSWADIVMETTPCLSLT